MWHIVNPTTVYDFFNEQRIELSLTKDKAPYDMSKFLDDISIWMDKNREMLKAKFLPLSILSVGPANGHVSAFLYGFFVSRALERNGLKVHHESKKVSKDDIVKEINKQNPAPNWPFLQNPPAGEPRQEEEDET